MTKFSVCSFKVLEYLKYKKIFQVLDTRNTF